MGRLLSDTLREAARRFEDRPALVTPGGWVLTYRQLETVVDQVAAGLASEGLAAGDVIALMLPSGPEYVVSYLAASRLGLTTAGINPRFPASDRTELLEALDPTVVVGTGELLRDTSTAAPLREVGEATSPEELRTVLPTGQPRDPLPTTGRSVPTALVLTSGTTGPPKAAVFGDDQIDAIRRIDHGGGWGGGGHALMATEPVHVGFMTKLAWYLRAGMSLGQLRHWRARDALEFLARHRVPVVGGIPAQIALMLRDPDFDEFDLSAVRTIVTGGSAVTPALLDEAAHRFGAGYSVRYSSTESGGVGTATDPSDLEEGRTSVGRPRAGVAVRIVDEGGHAVPEGETGRVALRSGAVMAGYFRQPDATAEVLQDGWLVTGDLGRLGSDGRLRLEGRSSDMYIRGGYNVHPQRVERVLEGHPAVAAVMVVPRSSDVMGQIGVALVAPTDPQSAPTLADLRAHAGSTLARHELPEDVIIVTELPLTSMHKLDREAARRLASHSSSAHTRSAT